MVENYKLLELPYNPQNVYVCGDSHGQFALIMHKITQNDIKDSIIIIAGDCGFGFENEGYYNDVYNSMRKKLSERNVTLLFLRGNHDNPEYFNGEKHIDKKHFKTISDYTVIKLLDNTKILCIGGAISIDRVYRINCEIRDNVKSKYYWPNEWPEYLPNIIDNIKNDGIDINYVVSHTSPDFAPLTDKNGVKNFAIYDETLFEDIDKERMIITKIYNHLIKKCNFNIETWFYGHFHEHKVSYSEENVKFIMLDCMGAKNASWDVAPVKNC